MTNPILQRLGFSDNDRVVVLHADDIGMNHASVMAYADLLAHSPLSSAATMVPCPWFPAAAQLFREQAAHSKIDVGVHLTLTSEWDASRWRPISTSDRASGLFDEEGYFYRDTPPVQAGATLEAVSAELRAQIDQAQAANIDITHIDSHMGTLLHPRFLQLYMELGFAYGVPAFAVRMSVEQLLARGIEQPLAAQIAAYLQQVEARGMPLFTSSYMMPLHKQFKVAERLEHAKRVLNSAEAGLHYFLIHPCIDTPALRYLAPDWEARVGDYNLFMSDEWQKAIDASGVKVVGMKALRDVMQNQPVSN